MRASRIALLLSALPCAVVAQRPAPPPEATQIAAAVLPLPSEFRDSATVLGYRGESPTLVTLRKGKGPFTCLANDPAGKQFHVACYHQSMEPFMERGRALRASGVKGDDVDSTRFREVRSGKLKMPKNPASLYTLTGGTYDPATNTAAGAHALFVVYMPFATTATTGLSAKPVPDSPWIMYPGTPKAHIMFVPKM